MAGLFTYSLSFLENAVHSGVAPSAAVAICVRGRLLARAAYGYASTAGTPVPVDMDTRYDMASLTKLLSTTMIALRMLEEGRLRLHDTVGQFFPSDPEKSNITLLQLMTHTSGLPPHILLSGRAPLPEDAVRVILDSGLVCAPGEQVNYSCMGYILLGKILEQLGDAPLDRLAESYVFRPLGMTRTGYLPKGGNFAATEAGPDGSFLCGTVHDENARFLGGISGNAGVFSDLNDGVKFAAMLACGGRMPDSAGLSGASPLSGGMERGGWFLSPATLRTALRNYTPGLRENRGLGFHLSGPGSFHGDLFPSGSFGHTGFTGTSLLINPDSGLSVLLLTNRVHPTRENLRLIRFRCLFHNAVMAEFSRFDESAWKGDALQ